MDLTKTDIKRAVQRHMARVNRGRGWKKYYVLRDGESQSRITPVETIGAVAEAVRKGQVIDIEAVIEDSSGLAIRQDWIAFWIGTRRIWAKRNAIEGGDRSEDTLIFEK
jgi:hypothetical protein